MIDRFRSSALVVAVFATAVAWGVQPPAKLAKKPPAAGSTRLGTAEAAAGDFAARQDPDNWTISEHGSIQIRESSGLVSDGGGGFWTHNDSGDTARIFRVDADGQLLQTIKLDGIEAVDFEDLTWAVVGGVEGLLIADVGDNRGNRQSVALHLIDRPKRGQTEASIRSTIRVRYPGGPRDCEAVGYDDASERIILIAKSKLPWCGVYGIEVGGFDAEQQDHEVVATHLTNLTLPMVTAMDVDRTTGDVVLCSYLQIFHFASAAAKTGSATNSTLPDRSDIVATLGSRPVVVDAPKIKQIEGGCFVPPGAIAVSSEGPRLILATLKR